MKNTDRQVITGGKLLRSGEGREIAAYLRDGCVWVAEFNAGRGEVHLAGAWFAIHRRRIRLHEVDLDAGAGLSAELRARIECLHDAVAQRTVGPACLAGALRALLHRLLHGRFVNRGTADMAA